MMETLELLEFKYWYYEQSIQYGTEKKSVYCLLMKFQNNIEILEKRWILFI